MEINSVANENVQYLPQLYSTVEYYENYSVGLHSRKSWLFTIEVSLVKQIFCKFRQYKWKDMLDARL